MAADEQRPSSTVPPEVTPSGRPARKRLRFGMKGLMLLPILAAAVLMAIDRWTAIPWSGLKSGGPVVFKIVNGSTGQILKGASLTIFEGGAKRFTMEAPSGSLMTTAAANKRTDTSRWSGTHADSMSATCGSR